MSGIRNRERLLVGAFAAVVVVVIASVAFAIWRSADKGVDTLPSLSTSSSTPATDPASDVSAAAIAAYNGYWDSYVAAAANATASTTDLGRFVADPLLTEVRAELHQTRDAGIIYRGRPKWTPRVTSINVATVPHSATIEDCFDNATWEPIFSATGKSAAAPGQATRYVITSTVKFFESRGWLLADSLADRSRTC